EVALKIINLGSDQGLKEFRALHLVKRVRHPNLVPIIAFWLKDDMGNLIDDNAFDDINLQGQTPELIVAMGLCEKSLADRLKECRSEGQPGILGPELLKY